MFFWQSATNTVMMPHPFRSDPRSLTGETPQPILSLNIMAIGNGIMSKISGSAGNLTFSVKGGEQIMSARIEKVRNPRTPAQVSQRVKFPNVVATYRAFHGLLDECFEQKRRKKRVRLVSNYNRFMAINLLSSS